MVVSNGFHAFTVVLHELKQMDPLTLLHSLRGYLQVEFRKLSEEDKNSISSLFAPCKAVCPRCNFAGAGFLCLNNRNSSKFPQPRFKCGNCRHSFTVGGRIKPRKRNYENQFEPPVKKFKPLQKQITEAVPVLPHHEGGCNLMERSDCDHVFQSCVGENETGISSLPDLIDIDDIWESAFLGQSTEKGAAAEEEKEIKYEGDLFDDFRNNSDGMTHLFQNYYDSLESGSEYEFIDKF